MAISDWPENERPREKLIERGATSLSDAELLAIFLRTGCTGKSAVDLARDLIKHFGSLRALVNASQQEFCAAQGLGPAKFTQLQAMLEMSRRHLAEQLHTSDCFTSSEAVRDFLRAQLRHRSAEVFASLFLNSQHQLIAFEELFQGSIDGAAIYPREVIKRALYHNASAVIFAHNHPSGVAKPSDADRNITLQLKQALELIDIRTLDHFIVGNTEVFSFAERGWL